MPQKRLKFQTFLWEHVGDCELLSPSPYPQSKSDITSQLQSPNLYTCNPLMPPPSPPWSEFDNNQPGYQEASLQGDNLGSIWIISDKWRLIVTTGVLIVNSWCHVLTCQLHRIYTPKHLQQYTAHWHNCTHHHTTCTDGQQLRPTWIHTNYIHDLLTHCN